MTEPEPRFARIAAMIADPTRARMLSALMGGQYLAAGELAAASGVTAATASGHLAKLVEFELVVARSQGRQRYFRLSDERIAEALEALSLVAERSAASRKWEQGAYRPLKAARTCFCHLAGELGVAWLDGLLKRRALEAEDDHFVLTGTGREALLSWGLTLPASPRGAAARRFARPCLDWSERRHHLAGTLAVALLDHSIEQRWLLRSPGSRALTITPAGQAALAPWLSTGG